MAERERAEEAEERARKEAADQERRRAAKAELEAYRQERLRSWVLRGGHEDDFEETIWPEARAQYLREKAGPLSHEERLRQSHSPLGRF